MSPEELALLRQARDNNGLLAVEMSAASATALVKLVTRGLLRPASNEERDPDIIVYRITSAARCFEVSEQD